MGLRLKAFFICPELFTWMMDSEKVFSHTNTLGSLGGGDTLPNAHYAFCSNRLLRKDLRSDEREEYWGGGERAYF